jgi:hypothetical protein
VGPSFEAVNRRSDFLEELGANLWVLGQVIDEVGRRDLDRLHAREEESHNFVDHHLIVSLEEICLQHNGEQVFFFAVAMGAAILAFSNQFADEFPKDFVVSVVAEVVKCVDVFRQDGPDSGRYIHKTIHCVVNQAVQILIDRHVL